jgi:hypothetical protein
MPMTAPKPEAPTLDEQVEAMADHVKLLKTCADLPEWNGEQNEMAEAILASLERLRAIENAKGMPEALDWVSITQDADKIVRDKAVWKRFIDGTPLANDVSVWMAEFALEKSAALRLHAQHLQDRLNRMEALMREPDEDMFNSLTDRMWKEHTSSTVWQAMSAALLAKVDGRE